MSAAIDASARSFIRHRARAKVPSCPRRACRAVHASRVRASFPSSSEVDHPDRDASARSTPSRRDALVGLTSALAAATTALGAPPDASAAVKLTPGGLDASRRFFQTFPPLWEPYFGFGERVTVRRELVPGAVWSLEQEQALDVLAMNIRTTVVRLERTGGLVVFAPQAPTAEFFKLLDELGRVEHVVLPTYAIEHKVWLPALARRYRDAQVWVADGLWSVPVNLPNAFLGINPAGVLVPSGTDRRFPNGKGDANDPAPPENPQPPWLDEMEYKVLRVDTAGANPYIEAVFLHKASRTLLVTDLVFSIPTNPPAVIDRDRLLNLAPDDPRDAPAPASDDALRAGWAKASLVVSFLGPSRQRQVEEGAFKGKLQWEPGWERSFAAIENRVLPSPILRTLVFSKGKGPTRRFLRELRADWGDAFDQIVPAHYDAPVRGTADDVVAAFSFLDAPDFLTGLTAPGSELPEEDMGTLLKVNDVLEFIGLGKGSE